MTISSDAAHHTDMTIASPLRQSKGTPAGGQFAPTSRPESTIRLRIGDGDVLDGFSDFESRTIVEAGYSAIDLAWAEEDDAENETEIALAGGKAHANAEIIAFLTNEPEVGIDYENLGEMLLDDRRGGRLVEMSEGWTGPGEITAVKRQLTVDYCRARARELFDAAESAETPGDAAHHFGRYEAFEEAALDLSANGAYGDFD